MGALIRLSPVLFLFLFFTAIYLMMKLTRFLGKWRRATEGVAKRYGGHAKKGRFPFFYPGAVFNYGRTHCELQNRRSRIHESGRQTDLVLVWPDPKFVFRLTAGNIHSNSSRWDRLSLVGLDDESFRDKFKVEANDPELTKRMLNSSVQWAFEQLRRHTFKKTLMVTIRKGRMTISKSGYIKDSSELDDFVRFGLELFDQLVIADIQGIEFLNSDVAKVVEDVKCPICSEVVEEFMVVCLRCKTPHCYDCWQYNGRCATFACDETRYVRMDDRIKYSV